MTGLMIGAEQTYGYFRKMQERITDFIVRTSGADRGTVVELMNCRNELANDIGTILYGEEAVKSGLIDRVGGIADALKKLRELIGDRMRRTEI